MGRQKVSSSKKYPVRISVNALHNVDEITGYIAFIAQQPLNAVRVGDKLFATFDRIAAQPFVFKECRYLPTKGKIYRQVKCLSWYVVFKITSTDIIILGVIHAARRPSLMKSLRSVK